MKKLGSPADLRQSWKYSNLLEGWAVACSALLVASAGALTLKTAVLLIHQQIITHLAGAGKAASEAESGQKWSGKGDKRGGNAGGGGEAGRGGSGCNIQHWIPSPLFSSDLRRLIAEQEVYIGVRGFELPFTSEVSPFFPCLDTECLFLLWLHQQCGGGGG